MSREVRNMHTVHAFRTWANDTANKLAASFPPAGISVTVAPLVPTRTGQQKKAIELWFDQFATFCGAAKRGERDKMREAALFECPVMGGHIVERGRWKFRDTTRSTTDLDIAEFADLVEQLGAVFRDCGFSNPLPSFENETRKETKK